MFFFGSNAPRLPTRSVSTPFEDCSGVCPCHHNKLEPSIYLSSRSREAISPGMAYFSRFYSGQFHSHKLFQYFLLIDHFQINSTILRGRRRYSQLWGTWKKGCFFEEFAKITLCYRGCNSCFQEDFANLTLVASFQWPPGSYATAISGNCKFAS